MNTESKFLRTVCKVAFSEGQEPQALRDAIFDEEKLYRLGLYHQILPLIANYREHLSKAFPTISARFFEKFRQYAITNAGRVMLYERFLADLDHKLMNEQIEYLLFKGPVLAFELYQYPHLRTFGDMDILIREESLEKMHRILGEMNCELCDDLYTVFPTEIIRKYSFARHYATARNPFVAIDVHLSLSGRLHPFQFDVNEFWEHSRSFRIGEKEYRTFDHPHQALYSLYHAFKHYFFKLIWIIDCRRNFQLPDFNMPEFQSLLKKYNLSMIWKMYNHIADDLWGNDPLFEAPEKRKGKSLIPKVDADLILQGRLSTSPSRAWMLLPLLYLPRLYQKLFYLWRQMFPPRDVVRDFYATQNLKPTWRNYISLRRKAVYELLND